MNTKDKWVITATIHDAERRELWECVFPGGVVPIESMVPVKVRVPERGEVDAYMLDLTALTVEQKDGVCWIIARRFGLRLSEVRTEIHLGVPIVAEGVTVASFLGQSDLTEDD